MTKIDRRKFLSASALAAAGLATAGAWRLAAADEPQKPSPGGERFRGQFLRLCDALCPVVDSERKVQFYIDSYAVRGLAVAHDLTGKREYLDVCRRWCQRMVDFQDRMDPPGAYYMNYGRRPGAHKGDWYIGDSSSIALALQAVGLRTPDAAESARLKKSVLSYAGLVRDRFVRPAAAWPTATGRSSTASGGVRAESSVRSAFCCSTKSAIETI